MKECLEENNKIFKVVLVRLNGVNDILLWSMDVIEICFLELGLSLKFFKLFFRIFVLGECV